MTKARITDLTQKLRDAAKVEDPLARAAIELIRLQTDAAKESMLGADGDEMLRIQGAARWFDKLHKDLTTTPPNIRAQETN